MKRNYIAKEGSPIATSDLARQTAFHEAGHAAAIYLRNKQQQLPSVFFQIVINTPKIADNVPNEAYYSTTHDFAAKIEGGFLMHNLPISLIESHSYFSDMEQHAYQAAYEADIINLLAGPLAEAKYTAMQDNEFIATLPVTIDALAYYGGASDIRMVYDYLQSSIGSKTLRERKISELIAKAAAFINNSLYWRAITALANFILVQQSNRIDCEQIIALLDDVIEAKHVSPAWT